MPTFPALDEEPAPLSLRARLLRVGLTLLVAVAVGGAGWGVSRLAGGGGASGTPSGRILVLTNLHALALVQPNGLQPQTLPLPDANPLGGSVGFVAPGGGLLLTDAGDTVTLRDGRPVAHSTALYQPLSAGGQDCSQGYCQTLTGLFETNFPFADDARSVVFSVPPATSGTGSGPAPVAPVYVVPVTGGTARGLGTGDGYAGDPQAAAAFVAVRARGAATPIDTAIEHRVAGGATTTVVTSAQVAQALGRSGTPLTLEPHPDPTGRLLAVVADDPTSGEVVGLVVYTRTGQLVARAPGAPDGPPSWSPSGRQLLVSTPSGAQLWTPGQAATPIAAPASAGLLQFCVWSPDERQALCQAYSGQGQSTSGWVLFDLAARSARSYASPGVPLYWVG